MYEVAQMVKNPAARETRVRSLSWDHPLKKGMATHILAWRIEWTEEPGGLQSIGSQSRDTTETNASLSTFTGLPWASQ